MYVRPRERQEPESMAVDIMETRGRRTGEDALMELYVDTRIRGFLVGRRKAGE
jgi:hypothetical protein